MIRHVGVGRRCSAEAQLEGAEFKLRPHDSRQELGKNPNRSRSHNRVCQRLATAVGV